MAKVTLTVVIDGSCSYCSSGDLYDHLKGIANTIAGHAEGEGFEDYNRKIQIDYESQEDINLTIANKISSDD